MVSEVYGTTGFEMQQNFLTNSSFSSFPNFRRMTVNIPMEFQEKQPFFNWIFFFFFKWKKERENLNCVCMTAYKIRLMMEFSKERERMVAIIEFEFAACAQSAEFSFNWKAEILSHTQRERKRHSFHSIFLLFSIWLNCGLSRDQEEKKKHTKRESRKKLIVIYKYRRFGCDCYIHSSITI